MKKILILLISCLSFTILSAQVALKLSSVTGNKGDNISIELRTDKFTKIQSTQFAISYDTTLMDYISSTDFAPGYSNISILDPIGGGKKGLIRTSWNNPDGENTTYPNNTVLFKINFKLTGNPCDSNLIKVVNATQSVLIEIIDENGNQAPFTLQDGKVKVNGPNCQGGGGGGGNDSVFTFIIKKVEVPKGTNGCVPITVKNFKKINTFQGNLKWDKTIARYTGISANRISGFSAGLTQISADSTSLKFLWEDVTQNGITHPDNTVLFEACFDAIGTINSVTDIDIIDVPGNPIEVTAGGINSNEVPYKIEKGCLKVVGAQNNLDLYLRDTMGTINTEMCVPIYVNNFTCINSFQFGVKFDKTKLSFSRVQNNSIRIGTANFNIRNDSILVIWDSVNTVNLSNGAALFSLCFNLTGPCDMNAALSFVHLASNSNIEFSGCNDPVTVRTTGSTINIKCSTPGPEIIILDQKDARCFGECNGTVTTTTRNGSGNFTFLWLNSNGTPVAPQITTKDASTLCAGTYRLQLTDVGVTPNIIVTSIPITIAQPARIIVNAQIMNESQASNDGKIELTVTGGTQGYRYKWKRLPNTNLPADTNSIIINKRCGNYEVMITDSKGCVLMDTFRIECYSPDPVCSINVLDSIKCSGDCTASLRSEVTGGTIQFKYLWSTGANTISINNLCAGTYTVTVTDSNTPVRTCKASYTVTEPTKLVVTLVDTVCSSGSNGSINISVSGGSPGYTYEWRPAPNGQIFANTEDVTQLAPGSYVVKVTDSKSCSASLTVTISKCGTPAPDLKVSLAIEPNGGGGTSCAGRCDGKITATATGGSGSYTYKWSHNPNLTGNIADNLCAGNYTVTVTDASQKTATATTRLNDAPAISINPKRISCATSNTQSDGEYEAVVSGGTRPYAYRWCNNESGVRATQLPSGPCSLIVTDANGCSATETFTVCIDGDPKGDCFKGNLAISPNGDGYNDNLEILCVLDYQNTLNIYNRWGHLVYSSVDYINQFNGVDSDGNILNEGTYMYVLTIKEPGKNDTHYKGTVTIVRQ